MHEDNKSRLFFNVILEWVALKKVSRQNFVLPIFRYFWWIRNIIAFHGVVFILSSLIINRLMKTLSEGVCYQKFLSVSVCPPLSLWVETCVYSTQLVLQYEEFCRLCWTWSRFDVDKNLFLHRRHSAQTQRVLVLLYMHNTSRSILNCQFKLLMRYFVLCASSCIMSHLQ
jgi:hypothetical protein